MKVLTACPNCETSYRVRPELLGRRARCERCGERFSLGSSIGDQPTPQPSGDLDSPSRSTVRSSVLRESRSETGRPERSRHTADTLPLPTNGSLPKKFGRFEIKDKLGVGGFGTVYRADDPVLDREVALKVPHPGLLADAKKRERYLREPKAAAKLRHPNIVPVFDANVEGENLFIAAALIEGHTLDEAIRGNRPNVDAAATIVIKLADALQYAHSQHVIHRDIKPSNVMLDEEGKPLLMDFGLARLQESAEQLTHDGAVMGTPAYMSPEQAAGNHDAIGPASDQYSLGVVLYELLCGKRPYSGTPAVVISQVIGQDPSPPSTHNSAIPKDLETICLKAMGREPEKRYASCAELAEDLRRWQQRLPIRARRIGPAERFTRWCRRNPAVAALTITVFLVFAAGLIATTWQSGRAVAAMKRAETNAAEALDQKQLANALKHRADEKAAEALAQLNEAQRARQHADGQAAVASAEKERADEKAAEALTEKARADEKAVEALAEKQRADSKAAEAKRASRRAYRHHYVAQLNQVQWDWEDAGIRRGRILERLERMLPEQTGGDDLRGFEWHFWRLLCHGNLVRFKELKGHADSIRSVAFSPEGRSIVSGSDDNTLKIWDLGSGEESPRRTLKGHRRSVGSVSYSPDGQWIVSGSEDFLVTVWDAVAGRAILALKGHTGPVTSAEFSPNGRWIVSGSDDNTAKVWDLETGREVLSLDGHTDSVRSAAFSPDGRRIVTGSKDNRLKVWDAATGQEILTLTGHTDFVWSVAYSPNGQRIVSGSWDNTAKLWDAATGQEIFSLHGHRDMVHSVAFSSDGRRIVTGSADKTAKVWDTATGQETLTLKGHNDAVYSVAFSTEGRRIVTGSADKTVKIWNGTPLPSDPETE